MLSPPKLTELRMLWETCAAGGLSPTTTVEQISYLLLLKSLSDQGSDDAGDDYRWKAIVALARQRSELCLAHLRDVVFPWLRHKEREAALPGVHNFLQHAHLAFNKPTLLAAALADIDTLFATDEPGQHAIIYDRLLSMEEEAIASSARPTGRIFTPDHISKLLCLLVDVRGDDLAWEPSCGNGHLLAHLYRAMQCKAGAGFSPEQLYGCDLDESCAFEAWMRLFLLGVGSPRVEHTDTLGSHFYESRLLPANGQGFATVVLANPPFSGVTDKADIGKSLKSLGTTKTELLFLEIVLQSLKPGGRAAIIVPEGLLFGSTKAHRSLRRRLLTEHRLVAVVSLPQGVFLPWTNLKTDLLLFEKDGTTEEVFFYEVQGDGFKQTNRRDPDPDHDDLLDLLMRVRLRTTSTGKPPPAEIDPGLWERWIALPPEARTQAYVRSTSRWDQDVPYTGEIVENEEPRSWTTALGSVAAKGHDLRPGGYKPYHPPEVEYEDPRTILRNLIGLEHGLLRDLRELEAMLGDPGSILREPESSEAHLTAPDTAVALVTPEQEDVARNGHQALTAAPAIEGAPEPMRPSPLANGQAAGEGADERPCLFPVAIPTGNPMIDAVVSSYFTLWERGVALEILSHKEGGYPQACAFLASQVRRRPPDRSVLPQGVCYTTRRAVIAINDARTPEKDPPDLQLSVNRLVRLAFPPLSESAPRQLALW